MALIEAEGPPRRLPPVVALGFAPSAPDAAESGNTAQVASTSHRSLPSFSAYLKQVSARFTPAHEQIQGSVLQKMQLVTENCSERLAEARPYSPDGTPGDANPAASSLCSDEDEADDVPDRLKYFLDQRKIRFLRKQFHLYDTDKSGAISIDELQVFLKDALGVVLDGEKLMEIIESVSPGNEEGLLTFRDFLLVWYQYCSDKDSKERITQMAFEFIDLDDSGAISLEEFTQVMTTMGDPLSVEECKLFFQLLDKGKKQELDEGEFNHFMHDHLDDAMPVVSDNSRGGPEIVNYLMRYFTAFS